MTLENISWSNLHKRILQTRWVSNRVSNPQPPVHRQTRILLSHWGGLKPFWKGFYSKRQWFAFPVTLTTLWAYSADNRHTFLIFHKNWVWHFMEIETVCMKCQNLFSGKIRKIFQNAVCFNFHWECLALYKTHTYLFYIIFYIWKSERLWVLKIERIWKN